MMNFRSKLDRKHRFQFCSQPCKKNILNLYPLSGKNLRAKKLINSFEKELMLHPVLYNNLIESILVENGKEKTLINLDSEVYIRNFKSNDEDEDDNKMITKLFEPNEIASSRKEFQSKTSLFSGLKNALLKKDITITEPPKSKSEVKLRVYTREHFEWLFKQNKKQNFYKQQNMTLPRSGQVMDKKKELNLEQKIKEFCKWAELNYDCKELELDAITLMKIFLVNYDKGPLIWAPINLQEINRKEFKLDLEDNFNSDSDDSSSEKLSLMLKKKLNEKKSDSVQNNNLKSNLERRNNYGKWYLPKKYWSKSCTQGVKSDKNQMKRNDKASSKLYKSNGVKLFHDFFTKNKKERIPYFLKQYKRKNILSEKD
ncbi:hypothetical protein BpHYR1_003421 [Brachionus plicatilis]|uniref:Uncharacterized protein n=1 Tax=Brachionus plicatilis TaxID=10195 RepID=A0A3M7RCD5_BRAPC|nr:hypothetical protein BpHYR1_003421 [Brachionus plicatilis]